MRDRRGQVSNDAPAAASSMTSRVATRPRLGHVVFGLGLIGAIGVGTAGTSLAMTAPASVTITSPGGIARRGELVSVTATDPSGWFCQLTVGHGAQTTAITGIVPTPAGAFGSGWLVPRTTTVRTWTVTVVCATSAADVRLGHGVAAHQVREVLPAVRPFTVTPDLVDVNSTIGYQSGSFAAGTGIVLAASGLVITNNHVVVGATSITAVDLGNHHAYRVRLVGVDVSHDLAVLQLVGAHALHRAPLGDSSRIVRGSGVSAVGNVGGLGGTPTITSGIITGVNESIVAVDSATNAQEHLSGLFETNALLQPGDSGGPLVDALGDVVGIDTAALINTDALSTNEGFAIPINPALAIARAITQGQVSKDLLIGANAYTGYLGIQVTPAVSGAQHIGVRVAQVLRGSPAARAALKPNDVIRAINTVPGAQPPTPPHVVTTPGQLATILDRLHPGSSVAMTWTGPSAPTKPVVVQLGTGSAR